MIRGGLLFVVGTIIFLVYLALFVLTIQYSKTANFANTPTNKMLELWWLLVAAIIFVVLLGYTFLLYVKLS